MKTKLQLAALALLSPFILHPSTLLAQGSLTPPGVPAPTMKTLAQIEPRTPISSAPFTISAPGSYYLTANLTVSSGDAITIATNHVTLDLNGFTIASTAPSATGYGILLTSNRSSVTILNGFIKGGVTNNGGVYGGPGFQFGILYYVTPPVNTRVANVSVSGCLDFGIYLGHGDSTVVESCTARTVGHAGICASTIKGSVAVDCGGDAIAGDQISDCRGECTGSAYGLLAQTAALNCYGSSSSGGGLAAGSSALNCYGYSSSGTGLSADTAMNCYGATTGNSYGLYATVAQNCYGTSSSYGLYTGVAQNCYGTTTSGGYGLYANTAQNCYGNSGGSGGGLRAYDLAIGCHGSSATGIGLNAFRVALGCYGVSSSGTGLSAYIANSCVGIGSPGVSATYKYNMP